MWVCDNTLSVLCFVVNVATHPMAQNWVPAAVNVASSAKRKPGNDPNRPKRPTSAYFYFVQLEREEAAKRGEKITRVCKVFLHHNLYFLMKKYFWKAIVGCDQVVNLFAVCDLYTYFGITGFLVIVITLLCCACVVGILGAAYS